MDAAGMSVPPLPDGTRFTVSIRPAVRGGDADGVLIEDSGITGQPYVMTRNDILEGNVDLIEHCTKILAAQPVTQLNVSRKGKTVRLETVGLDQLDVFLDHHPAGPGIPIGADGVVSFEVGSAEVVDVLGFSQQRLRQRRRLRKRS